MCNSPTVYSYCYFSIYYLRTAELMIKQMHYDSMSYGHAMFCCKFTTFRLLSLISLMFVVKCTAITSVCEGLNGKYKPWRRQRIVVTTITIRTIAPPTPHTTLAITVVVDFVVATVVGVTREVCNVEGKPRKQEKLSRTDKNHTTFMWEEDL